MLKYSTYNSIYNEVRKEPASGNPSAYNQFTRIRDGAVNLITVLPSIIRRISFMKFALVLLLIISGFTVVGNVFAGSVAMMKPDKRIVVERGDTLWSIALKNKPDHMKTAVYIEGIMKSNSLQDSGIKAGDILNIPIYE